MIAFLMPGQGKLQAFGYIRASRKEELVDVGQSEQQTTRKFYKKNSRLFLALEFLKIKRVPCHLKANSTSGFHLLIFIFFAFLQAYFFSAKVETIAYSQFKQDLVEGKVVQLTIDPENITGTLSGSPNQDFTTVRVNDPDLVKELDDTKSQLFRTVSKQIPEQPSLMASSTRRHVLDLAFCHEENGVGDGRHVFW